MFFPYGQYNKHASFQNKLFLCNDHFFAGGYNGIVTLKVFDPKPSEICFKSILVFIFVV